MSRFLHMRAHHEELHFQKGLLSGVTGGGGVGAECCSWHFSLGNFCWPTGKRGVRKMERKRRKIWKGRWKIENGREKSMKMSRGLWFFFFFFFLCFCHFLKPLKFVWGLPKWTIFTRKKHISCQEKIGKKWLCPLWKIFLLRHWAYWYFKSGL